MTIYRLLQVIQLDRGFIGFHAMNADDNQSLLLPDVAGGIPRVPVHFRPSAGKEGTAEYPIGQEADY